MKNLILTGWGWKDYSVAAAVALKALGGDAEVMGMSRRRLPEFLEDYRGKCTRIVMLGVSLTGDVPRLVVALERLKSKGIAVEWISALAMPPEAIESLSPLLEVKVHEADTITEAVGAALGMDVNSFMPYVPEKARGPAPVRDWHDLVDAATYAYLNYQNLEPYAKAVRYLAEGKSAALWDESCRRLVAQYHRQGGREFVGKSAVMQTLQDRINRIAAHADARVLILGESGTGKETAALQIHAKSSRKDEDFIPFNCASVNPDLLESRFLGYEKGAFTGAEQDTPGLFELANGGTLFLDEIGELPLEAQGVLLRVLEEGRFMRMHGKKEIEVNVRVVAATNRNLPARVREGKFRADLYQRLNVVQLRLPPLREHKDDIRDIADGWWLRNCQAHLAEEQLVALQDYDYPGNVRELQNLLERAVVLDETDFAALLAEHKAMNADLLPQVDAALYPPTEGSREASAMRGAASPTQDPPLQEPPDNLDAAMRLHVRRVYEKYAHNISKTAEALDISRNTLKKYL